MFLRSKTDRIRDRALRLQQEASNCVRFAIGERDTSHAAALLDEALRLAHRSRELTAAGG